VVYHTTCLVAKSRAEAAAFTAVHYTIAAVIPSSQHLSTRAGWCGVNPDDLSYLNQKSLQVCGRSPTDEETPRNKSKETESN